MQGLFLSFCWDAFVWITIVREAIVMKRGPELHGKVERTAHLRHPSLSLVASGSQYHQHFAREALKRSQSELGKAPFQSLPPRVRHLDHSWCLSSTWKS